MGKKAGSHAELTPVSRQVDALPEWERREPPAPPYRVGILRGEGIGPEVIDASMKVLEALAEVTEAGFDVRYGGPIGVTARRESGRYLTPEVEDFCREIFQADGAVLCGPGGGRFVYDLRARFDLYCKLVPLRPLPCLSDASVLRPEGLVDVDILIVRENLGGLYQGHSGMDMDQSTRRAVHTFSYDESQVQRIVETAARAAQRRRGRLCVVTKPGGIPHVSQLWQEVAGDLAPDFGVALEILEVDNASYQVIADPRRFDVIAAPNMFGDVLADGASLLLGSRGMSYSGNFGSEGRAVYQTGHGAAYDLAESDSANPVGQIQSLAMMLRESFGLVDRAGLVQLAVEDVLAAGWRTRDVMASGCRKVGTGGMGERIAQALRSRLGDQPRASRAVAS